MSRVKVFILLLIVVFSSSADQSASLKSALEDDLQFLFKWPGDSLLLENDLKEVARKNMEILEIKSSNNEKYRCTVPLLSDDLTDELNENSKKDPNTSNKELINTSSLLENIYSRKLCSYRIESYWIYELCHGQFIKQYHETKSSGKRLVTNEFFLGYFDPSKQEPDYFKKNDNEMIPNVHWRTLGGQRVPMFAVKYTDGTPCDILANIPRETTVFYACEENGNDNIVGFEEISSCVYEIVVVSKWVCSHPAYSMPEKVYDSISCYSVDDAPMKPKELTEIENDQALMRSEGNRVKMTDQQGRTFIIHYKTIEEDEAAGTDEELNDPLDPTATSQQQEAAPATNQQQQQQPAQPQQPQHQSPQQIIHDDAQREMINAFLSGVECLRGGTGWWKYEVCLGKQVSQYHEDEKSKKRLNIILGSWNLEKHLDWLNKNPSKRPSSISKDRNSVSQFYSNGDYCELSNKNRVVEVKYKCIRNKPTSHAISLYLLEPQVCEYILVIESPWLCNYVESLDSNAMQVIQQPTSTPPPPQQQQQQQRQDHTPEPRRQDRHDVP